MANSDLAKNWVICRKFQLANFSAESNSANARIPITNAGQLKKTTYQFYNNSNYIDSLICYQLQNVVNLSERQPRRANLAVIFTLLNLGSTIKFYTEVVLDGGKLFVGRFDGATTNKVHFFLLHHKVKLFHGLLIKRNCLDQGAITVHQV